MTSKAALINLKLDVSYRGKLSKFQQRCFDILEKEFEIPTLEECIKEWEEKGFEIISHTRERFEVYKQWIERINHCSHYTSAKVVIEKDFFYIVGQFSHEYTQLLTKTLKALEVEDE